MGDHFVWKESFNIGDDEIDEQHKLFLDYVNECYNAACLDSQSQVTGATIYDLKAYAATHFRFEENLMKENGYPDLDRHIKEHLFFEMQVAEIEQVRAGGGKRSVDSLLQFLKGWFLRHILEHDKKLAAFLKPRKNKMR
jgi:hemerythrin